MAAATIVAVEPGWAGDRKRNLVALTLGSTNADTVTPRSVGLQKIEAVVDAGIRTGTINVQGETHTLTNIGVGPYVGWAAASVTITVETAGNAVLYFQGW
jgi:hypothetical protein